MLSDCNLSHVSIFTFVCLLVYEVGRACFVLLGSLESYSVERLLSCLMVLMVARASTLIYCYPSLFFSVMDSAAVPSYCYLSFSQASPLDPVFLYPGMPRLVGASLVVLKIKEEELVGCIQYLFITQ
ncbi:hypothetical protein Droror1_Dr00017740 [Drosera rotundifolia]